MNVVSCAGKSLGVLALCYASHAAALASNAIVTGNQSDTYYRIGEDLKQYAMPELRNLTSKGAVDNIKALSKTAGVSFAIVQSDVYQTYVNLEKNDPDPAVREWASDLLHSLRVIAPLYNEEIYFIVRKDSPMQELQDIEDKRLAIGPDGSGANLTAKNIYYKLFGKAPVLIGGQPLPLLQRLGKDYKLLATNIKNDATEALLKDYSIGFADQKNYPFLPKHMPVMMVQSYLVTAQFRDKQRNDFVKKFAGALCQNYEKLQEHGHEKWKALTWSPANPRLPSLLSGWSYSTVTKPILESCAPTATTSAPIAAATPSSLPCSMEDRAIGFCQ
jgi:TRAP-type uncharacterized transport system substrate-binding protein